MSVENSSYEYESEAPGLLERTSRFFELSVNSVLNSASIGVVPGALIALAGAPVAGAVAMVIGAGAMAYGGYKYQQRTKRRLG